MRRPAMVADLLTRSCVSVNLSIHSCETAASFGAMKTTRSLIVLRVVALLAIISAGYCFWLMTVPLSYDLVYVVVGGFIVSVGVFVTTLITLLVLHVRHSHRASHVPPITPTV